MKYLIIAVIILFSDILVVLTFPYNLINNDYSNKIYDCAIVLFSGNPYNKLNPESLRRVNFAISLYKNNQILNIIFSGGARKNTGFKLGADLMTELAIKNGITQDVIISESSSFDTINNLKESYDIAKNNSWDSIVIIASKMHLLRARYIAKKLDIFYNKAVSIDYLSYSYKRTEPKIGWISLWYDIHYNFGAYLLFKLLPYNLYSSYVKHIRT